MTDSTAHHTQPTATPSDHGSGVSDCPATANSETKQRWLRRGVAGLMVLSALVLALVWSKHGPTRPQQQRGETTLGMPTVVKTDAQWRRLLTEEQFHILRESGTERPFANRYHDHEAEGIYTCVACGNRLFSSSAKFDSGTGWPSFHAPLNAKAVRQTMEPGLWQRTEVACSRCGGHLGHVFDDGPPPTGLRYCMNSAALQFVATSSSK